MVARRLAVRASWNVAMRRTQRLRGLIGGGSLITDGKGRWLGGQSEGPNAESGLFCSLLTV